jgi:hypothetical protein
MTEESKPEISQVETSAVEHHHKHHTIEELAQNEDEPQTPYQLGWRTILCVITLSMGNVCAALANTVSNLSGLCCFKLTLQTNTTIKFQVATVARSPADAALASWIANGNFLVVLAAGPIFVSGTRSTWHNMQLIDSGFSWRSIGEEMVSCWRRFARYRWISSLWLSPQDHRHHRWQHPDGNRKCWMCE